MTVSSSPAHELADALGLVATDDGEAAELLVISGSQTDRVPLAEYARRIAPAAARRMPCVCTNPNKLMMTASSVCPSAGAIAVIY
jgi:ribonucleotide monophosphatase NagD (HAD superfamily)